MRIKSGIKLLAEFEGEGEPARKGDSVVYNWRLYRNQGEEITLNEQQATNLPVEMIRVVDGYRFIDHRTILGSRQTVAGVEYSLYGMKPGGYRKIRISPHLAYRDQGLDDLIPSNAVLIVELWLREACSGLSQPLTGRK
jgi:FKBP-type peptidyl-prolyl cis-trans isomerase (trigger factor)